MNLLSSKEGEIAAAILSVLPKKMEFIDSTGTVDQDHSIGRICLISLVHTSGLNENNYYGTLYNLERVRETVYANNKEVMVERR